MRVEEGLQAPGVRGNRSIFCASTVDGGAGGAVCAAGHSGLQFGSAVNTRLRVTGHLFQSPFGSVVGTRNI